MPQKVSRASIDEGREATLFFRVRTPLQKPTFFVEGIAPDGTAQLIKRKKGRIAVPAEMEQVTIDLGSCAPFTSLRVRVEGDN